MVPVWVMAMHYLVKQSHIPEKGDKSHCGKNLEDDNTSCSYCIMKQLLCPYPTYFSNTATVDVSPFFKAAGILSRK
jgi:hypothetical protein